jgi:hypothetical protein
MITPFNVSTVPIILDAQSCKALSFVVTSDISYFVGEAGFINTSNNKNMVTLILQNSRNPISNELQNFCLLLRTSTTVFDTSVSTSSFSIRHYRKIQGLGYFFKAFFGENTDDNTGLETITTMTSTTDNDDNEITSAVTL